MNFAASTSLLLRGDSPPFAAAVHALDTAPPAARCRSSTASSTRRCTAPEGFAQQIVAVAGV